MKKIFILGLYKKDIWILEKVETPLLNKYAIYENFHLYFDVGHYFEKLDRDRTIDNIIKKERWLWRGDSCINSKKTFALLAKIEKEDLKIKQAIKINYHETTNNPETFKVGFFD